MMDLIQQIKTTFPLLSEPRLLEAMETHGKIMEVKAGATIMNFGSYIKVMPLVTRGAIKVMRENEEGEEVFLYFLYPGQSCAMTVQCCLANAPSQVKAVAEEDTTFIAIPIKLVYEWIHEFNAWKEFILTTYSDRFSELIRTIDSIVFQKLDERLLEYLQEKKIISGSKTLTITHQSIAADLHSSREVISRLLKQFEKMGKIKLGRNKIELH